MILEIQPWKKCLIRGTAFSFCKLKPFKLPVLWYSTTNILKIAIYFWKSCPEFSNVITHSIYILFSDSLKFHLLAPFLNLLYFGSRTCPCCWTINRQYINPNIIPKHLWRYLQCEGLEAYNTYTWKFSKHCIKLLIFQTVCRIDLFLSNLTVYLLK